MSHTPEPVRRATYADIEALPPHVVGEILAGELVVSPRPASRHTHAASALGGVLMSRFQLGQGGPGGWYIYFEPELSLGIDPAYDPVVPDLAGWRVESMTDPPDTAQFHAVPQWVCEVLSPRTRRTDRFLKVPFYARAGVSHLWLVDAETETIEVFALHGENWLLQGVHAGDDVITAEPFEAAPFPLSWLWRRPTPEPPLA